MSIEQFQSLAAHFGAALRPAPQGCAFTFVREDRRIHVQFAQNSRAEPFVLEIAAGVGSLPPIVMTPEDRAAQRLGIQREVQIGDPAFDSRVYIEAQVPDEVARQALSNPNFRQGVVYLLDSGFDRITAGFSGLTLNKMTGNPADLEPAHFARVLGAVEAMINGLPVENGAGVPAHLGIASTFSASVFLAAAAAGYACALHFAPAPSPSGMPMAQLQLIGAGGGLLLALLAFPILFLVNGSGSKGHLWLTALQLLLAFPAAGAAIAMLLVKG